MYLEVRATFGASIFFSTSTSARPPQKQSTFSMEGYIRVPSSMEASPYHLQVNP